MLLQGLLLREQKITPVLLKTEFFHRNDDTTKQFKTLLKRENKLRNVQLATLERQNQIKPIKLQQVF